MVVVVVVVVPSGTARTGHRLMGTARTGWSVSKTRHFRGTNLKLKFEKLVSECRKTVLECKKTVSF